MPDSERTEKKKVDEAWKEQVRHDQEKTTQEKEVKSPEEEKTVEENQGKEKGETTATGEEQKYSLPDPDLPSFISSLGMQAMVHLGELPDPFSRETKKNLEQAKYTIDLIVMLKDKTEGNRTDEETNLIENMLYSLQTKYLKAISYL